MAIDRSVLHAPAEATPNAKCPTGQTAAMEKIDEQRAIERAWEALKKFIAHREKFRCRLCGKACHYGAAKVVDKADAHHIIFASAGGPDASWNLIYLCRGCHDLIHVLKRFFLSGNADEKDELGKGTVKVERPVEGGFEVVGFI